MKFLLRATAFAVALFCLTVPAFAHAILIRSTPAAKAVVSGGHLQIEMVFNSRIDGARSHMTLVGPSGKGVPLAATRQTAPQTLASGADRLAPGAYRLRWVVLSNDGHITNGEIPFTVK